MKSQLRSFAIVCLLLLLTSTIARAGDPIPGLDVKLGKNGQAIATETTGNNGTVTFTGLQAGATYTITVDNSEMQKIAIKEQGVRTGQQGATYTFELKVNGNTRIDITKSSSSIEVRADKDGQLRATINTTRSNIKHTH